MPRKKAEKKTEMIAMDPFSRSLVNITPENNVIEARLLKNSRPSLVSTCTVLLANDAFQISSKIDEFDKAVLDAVYTLYRKEVYAQQFHHRTTTLPNGEFSVRQIAMLVSGRQTTHVPDELMCEISRSLIKLSATRIRINIHNEMVARLEDEMGKIKKSPIKIQKFKNILENYDAYRHEDLLPITFVEFVKKTTGESYIPSFRIKEPPCLYCYADAIHHYEIVESDNFCLPDAMRATRYNVGLFTYLREFVITAKRSKYNPRTIEYKKLFPKIIGKAFDQITRTERNRLHKAVCEILNSFDKQASRLSESEPYSLVHGSKNAIMGIELNFE